MISKVYLNETESECTMCGMCESICEDIFDASGVMKVKKGDYAAFEKQIRQAASSCPSGRIGIA